MKKISSTLDRPAAAAPTQQAPVMSGYPVGGVAVELVKRDVLVLLLKSPK